MIGSKLRRKKNEVRSFYQQYPEGNVQQVNCLLLLFQRRFHWIMQEIGILQAYDELDARMNLERRRKDIDPRSTFTSVLNNSNSPYYMKAVRFFCFRDF